MSRAASMAFVAAISLIVGACGGDDEAGPDTSAAAVDTAPATAADTADPATTAGDTDTTTGDTDTTTGDTDTTTGDSDSGDAPVEGFDIDAVLAADPDCAEPVTGEAIKIGYAADFSDLGGFADVPGSAAAEFFAELVNCAGGIDGAPLEIVVRDISGDPETTALAATELIDEGVVAMLGPPFPDFGFPLLQVTNGEVAVLFTASTEPALSDPAALSYLVAFDDTQQATAAARFALEQGWETATTFSSPGPYFGYNPEVFTAEFEAGGGTVIEDFTFVPNDDVDFSTQVNEIAGGDHPDVVYSAMLSFQLTALKGQLAGAGVETNYLTTDAFEATGGYGGDDIEGIFHTTHAFPTANEGRVVTFDEAFAASTGAPSESPTFAALAVDGIAVIIDSILRTGSTDPAEVGAAIPDAADVQGLTGTLTYNGTGTPTKAVYVHEVVDGAPSLAATVEVD